MFMKEVQVEEKITNPPFLDMADYLHLLNNLFCRFDKGSESRLQVYQSAVQTLGMACYIQGALSSMMFLAYEFAEDFTEGVLTNTNCGGNVA